MTATRTRTVKLGTLEPGARFIIPFCALTGTLIRVTPTSALVRYDQREREVTIRDKTFSAPSGPVNISAGTEVIAL